MWNRISQFWTEERWIRVTDDENNLRWVSLNHPVTAAEMAQEMVDSGQPVPPELERIVMVSPQHVVRTTNPVAELDVDIIMQDAPDSVNIQSEQFEMLVEMWTKAPDRIPLEMVVEASSLRNKSKLIEAIKAPQQPNPQQQEAAEIQKAVAIAEIRKTDSETAKNVASAQNTAAEAARKQTEAMLAAEFGVPQPIVSI